MADFEKPVVMKSSLVTDVLQKTGQLEQEDFHLCVKKMLKKADEVKAELFDTIYKEYSYGGFEDLSSSTLELNWKVTNLLSEIDSTSTRIKGSIEGSLEAAADEHSDLVQQLKETNAIRVVLTKLGKIHMALDAVPATMNNNEYRKAAKLLEIVNEQLGDLPKAGQEGKIFTALREEKRKQHHQLIHKLDTIWKNSIVWSTPSSASVDSVHTHLGTHLKLRMHGTGIEEGIAAMAALGLLDKKLKIFGKKLVQFIFRPLIIFPSLNVTVSKENPEELIISLNRETTKVKVIDPGKIFTKLSAVLEVMQLYFNPTRDTKSPNSNSMEHPVSILSHLGSLVWPVLSEDIIKDCLAKSIPNTSVQLEKYQDVIRETETFEERLQSFSFISECPSSLTKYVKDVGVHFGNKKCQDLLVTARDLMKDDIHDTLIIDKDSDTAVLASLGEIKEAIKGNKLKGASKPGKSENDETLSQFTFHLPTCRISESTKKLMDLAYSTLIEATSSPQQTAVQLFYAVRNMFELYCSVVPAYHKDSLTTLPQLAALHHNNCMYIAHLLLTAGYQFKSHLPEPLNQGTATFMDLVPVIREIGEKCLFDQLKRQRSQLLDIIQSAEGFADANEDHRGIKIERAIKQVLHQLLHLNKIWQGVLPFDLFLHSLGALLDAVLQEITNEVFKLEDLSSEEAHQLHSLLTIVIDKGPELFQEGKKDQPCVEPLTVVPHWSRYKQLIDILEASLQELTDAWADGKGLLAQDFTAGEVRSLIRALFQNTDRRAAVLAKITSTQ